MKRKQEMKKTVVIIMLAIVAALVVADLSKGGNNDKKVDISTPLTIERPTTTTIDSNTSQVLSCVDEGNSVASEMETIQSETNALLRSSNPSNTEMYKLVKDSRLYISHARTWVRNCGSLAPEKAANYVETVNNLEDSTDDLEETIVSAS
jgi:hypothetical protein